MGSDGDAPKIDGTDAKPIFILTYITPSKLHFCEEYTYFRSGFFRHKGWRFWRYRCSCSDSKQCEAHVYIHKDDIIITDSQHNHHPLVYWKTKKAKFIQLASGSKLLLYKKYTFSRSGKTRGGGSRFTCSSSNSKKCKAHIHVNKDNVITLAAAEHTHEPLKYMDTKEGYVRINPKYPYHYNVQAEIFADD
ncbi:hypothetical protein KGM_208271 [Danaus plexippus plexippus]|uniref:FLYWCH-type domain-containing protein n=1 Tax=Danaus plexippus plexippus TaxID=278856 RepID=A0A212EXQ2_DANPL|nr:hypothetical protein KGM_208271 [Danaus plexippus plexippus]